jgi:uncharacterized membrane protein
MDNKKIVVVIITIIIIAVVIYFNKHPPVEGTISKENFIEHKNNANYEANVSKLQKGTQCEGQCVTEYKGKMTMPVRHLFLIKDHKGREYVTDHFKYKDWNQANLKAFVIDKTFYVSNENSEIIINTDVINVIRNNIGSWQLTIDERSNEGNVWNLSKFAGVASLSLEWIDLVGWDSFEYKIKMIT